MIKINQKIKDSGSKTKMKLLVKCLNMILLNKGDPFLVRRHQQYMLIKRNQKQDEEEQNYYMRM